MEEVVINILETGGGGSPPDSDPTVEGLYLPDAYEATPFFAVVQFLIRTTIIDPETLEETFTEEPASSVTSSFNFAQYGITYSNVDASTIRLDGPVVNAFTDQYYQFVLPDMSTPILPPNTTTPFYSLIKYSPPANKTILLTYTFTVNNSYDVVVNQFINWLYESAVGNIDNLVSRGIK